MILVQEIANGRSGMRITETLVCRDKDDAYEVWTKHIKTYYPNTSQQDIDFCFGDKCFIMGGDRNLTWTEA